MQLDTIKRSKSDNEEITQRYESIISSLQKENDQPSLKLPLEY